MLLLINNEETLLQQNCIEFFTCLHQAQFCTSWVFLAFWASLQASPTSLGPVPKMKWFPLGLEAALCSQPLMLAPSRSDLFKEHRHFIFLSKGSKLLESICCCFFITGNVKSTPLLPQAFTPKEIVGFSIGSVSSVLYLSSRLPQMYTNVSMENWSLLKCCVGGFFFTKPLGAPF